MVLCGSTVQWARKCGAKLVMLCAANIVVRCDCVLSCGLDFTRLYATPGRLQNCWTVPPDKLSPQRTHQTRPKGDSAEKFTQEAERDDGQDQINERLKQCFSRSSIWCSIWTRYHNLVGFCLPSHLYTSAMFKPSEILIPWWRNRVLKILMAATSQQKKKKQVGPPSVSKVK